MKYLDQQQLTTHLSLGRPVEQWLGIREGNDHVVIRWLRINPEKDGSFDLYYHESFDDGNESYLDVYSFESYNPDLEDGLIHSFKSYREALDASIALYGARINNFVGAGMIQAEYEAYLKSRNRL